MPGMYEIKYLPEGRVERFFGSRGNYYEFEDGSRLDVHTIPAWCRRCAGMTHGENVETLEEIDRQLADLHDPDSQLYRFTQRSLLPELDHLMPRDQFRLDLIEKAKKRRLWRERRVSPPRCIHCGSADIVIFRLVEPTPHPAGAGTIEVSAVGMCSTQFNEWFFTPEGERIARHTKPTYWHHPGLDDDLNKPGGAVEWLRRTGRLRGEEAE